MQITESIEQQDGLIMSGYLVIARGTVAGTTEYRTALGR
ncbi:MAG: hypothetical protein JWM36_4376 [Hyphomicrobiales bacterium]|nr:hypothetical protein [Hyphomicrobiales bacterium]